MRFIKQNSNKLRYTKYKTLVPIFIPIGVCILLVVLFWKWDTDKPITETIHIEIDTKTSSPLRKELYGFNSNMMSGDYGYLDEDFVALTKALRPKTLRFPGGTVGNFYHWRKSGFNKDEMGTTLNPQLNKRNRGNYVKLQKRRNGIISFDDFIRLCNDLKITPIVMVNLWTGSPEESAEWVRYSEQKGYDIKYWELGNEYYLPHYVNKFRTARAYLQEARKHAISMKDVDPNIKLSVCASPVAFHKEGWLLKTAQRRWDKQLAENSTSSEAGWFDAFSVHVYAYKAMKDVDIQEMRGYLFGWIHFGIDEAMDYYQELFPNKEMWVTEWNIANPANRVANTQLHAMYAADFFMKMLSLPKITHANFHVITGPGKGFPAFSRITPPSKNTFWKYGGEPETDYGNTIRRTVYYSFQLIGEAVDVSDLHFSVSLQHSPHIEGGLDYSGKQVQGLQVQAIGNSVSVLLLISNRTSDEHHCKFVIDGKQIKEDVNFRYVSNEMLTATNGGNAEINGSGEMEVRNQEWTGKLGNFNIPKNSFGVLKVSR